MFTLQSFVSLHRRAVALVAAILLVPMIAAPAAAASAIAIPLVTNGGFELPGDGPTRSSAVGMQAPTAAAGWSTWNNDPVETATDLVPSTLPGYGGGMLHVTVAGTRLVNGSGVYRPYAAVDTGPTAVRAQVWLYVVNGQVGIGTGNGGHTGIDAVTSTTGRWQLLTAVNGVGPANEVIIYAINRSAEFYIGAVTVTSTPSPYDSATPPSTGPAPACAARAPNSPFAFAGFQSQWQPGEAIAPNFWGPTGTGGLQEQYTESPGGQRLVQYFDKGRMELTNPTSGGVTNGLLANELISGRLQVGDGTFQSRAAANIPIAGDPDNAGPTYNALGTTAATLLNSTPAQTGNAVAISVAANGSVSPGSAGAGSGPTALTVYDGITQHNVPQGFAQYRDKVGLLTIGYAKSEPFLASVKVAGQQKQVMVQVFERRVLTYTADNPAAFQVEMGNIGQHYYRWRYCT